MQACLIVLVSYLKEFKVVRSSMSVGYTLGSPLCCLVTVGIFYGIENILNKYLCGIF